MAGQIDKITVKAGKTAYAIYIGNRIFESLVEKEEIQGADRVAVVVSSRVYEIHESYIAGAMKSLPGAELFLMADGEENKNYRYAEMFLENFLSKGLTRKSVVIAIGGGVVGDFAGFLASVYMRGVRLVHVPTTLLAMVDSSIGGKTAVNLSAGKNIVGTFHQPSMVITDISFLHTLDDGEFKNGLVEALKHGLIGDRATVRIFEENNVDSIRSDRAIAQLIIQSASFKGSIVEFDEKESGKRAILNYGHTIGHAIESLLGYRDLSHGEAVALGMKIKLAVSRRMGWLSDGDVKRVDTIFRDYDLVRKDLHLLPEDIVEHIQYDKKNSGGKFNFVLLKGIGNPLFNQQIDEKVLFQVLEETLG
jgi:3-dehydroquinate synthase